MASSNTCASRNIAFVTSDAWADLYEDDHPAVDELRRRGHIVEPVVWDDPTVDWTTFDSVVLRSCWDYYLKIDAFREWIADLERKHVPVWNPAATLRWNLDKIYLRELEAVGVPIVPTEFAERNARLSQIAAGRGWDEIVLKPRVSAAGHRTVRLKASEAESHQAELDDLIAHGGALVQRYLPAIESDGEWSFMFIAGRFSHAARKRAAAGEFRVQFQYGGTAEPAVPSDDLIRQAKRVVDAVPLPWLYARVDGCEIEGKLLLMELEMLEPCLFMLQDPSSPARLADAIEARLPTG